MDRTATPSIVKEIDLTKGFSSWHVKWPVGILGDNFKRIVTKISALGEEVPEKDIKFQLSILESTEFPDTKFQVGLHRFGPPKLPVFFFFRLALCYEGEEPIFGWSQCLLKAHRGMKKGFPADALKRDAKLTVHCWIDIPHADLNKIGTKRKYCDDNQEYELPIYIENFAALGETMFNGVTGEDKVFQAFSDVTLVPTKMNDNDDDDDDDDDDTDERRFFCHRAVLASRSSVFLRMFAEKSWKEGEERIVEIEDIDAEIMEIVLYHIYTGKFFMGSASDFIPNIIYAADKYHLNDLKDWAVYQAIIGNFSDADRADHLLLAEKHNLPQLKAACIAVLSSNIWLSRNEEIHGKLSKELLKDVSDAMAKRQLESTQIIVTTTVG